MKQTASELRIGQSCASALSNRLMTNLAIKSLEY
jgi:hypothetical protein